MFGLRATRALEVSEIDELAAKIDAQHEGRELLKRCAVLSANERAAIELVDLAELTPKEAAVALGVPRGVFRMRLSRARARLERSTALMTEFEDNLWLEVVREHGDKLARARRPVRKHRRATRHQLLAGTTVGLAAAATAAALLFAASTSPPAFAVTRNPDGTVTVNLRQPSGIAGANEKLAAMGVRAQIAVQAKTPPKLVCPGGTVPTITFDPTSIPRGEEVVITPGAGNAAALKGYKAGSNGGGNPGAGATGGGNNVVRLQSGGSNIRTQSGADNHVARMYCP